MRQSSWALAVLAGIAAAFAVGLNRADPLAMLFWGGIVFGLAGCGMAWADWIDYKADRDAYRRKLHAEAERIEAETALLWERVPPEKPVPVIRAVPYRHGGSVSELPLDDTRTTRWLGWQTAAERLAGWYSVRRSLTADDLAPGAVAGRDEWVALTGELARVGLLDKRNGRPTVWAVPFSQARARIEAGALDWTDDADAPEVTLPPRPTDAKVVDGTVRAPESSNA